VLIDGLWVRAGLDAQVLTSASAIAELEYAISKLLPADPDSVTQHKMARQKIENVAYILMGSNAYKEQALQGS